MRPAQFASRPKVNVIATVVIFAVALMFVFRFTDDLHVIQAVAGYSHAPAEDTGVLADVRKLRVPTGEQRIRAIPCQQSDRVCVLHRGCLRAWLSGCVLPSLPGMMSAVAS